MEPYRNIDAAFRIFFHCQLQNPRQISALDLRRRHLCHRDCCTILLQLYPIKRKFVSCGFHLTINLSQQLRSLVQSRHIGGAALQHQAVLQSIFQRKCHSQLHLFQTRPLQVNGSPHRNGQIRFFQPLRLERSVPSPTDPLWGRGRVATAIQASPQLSDPTDSPL